jgi:hypothetical protein
MSYSNYLEAKLLDSAFGGVPFIPSGILWIALSNTDVGEDGSTITEPPFASGYSRAFITNDKSNWSSAEVGSGFLYNVVPITFPSASGDWGTISYFGVFDQQTSGNLYGAGNINRPKFVYSGDTPIFASGHLYMYMD